ncbi:universal stress protein [Actinomadura sp. HBU206391]|uniref:universal stress protein n=1 Tax=Actinomadura sp. HBU206391 TaxID=2731692 RepID=UPI001650C4B8|nr:universal stress protein [Actinomadura sp. HBU206391]MBC6457004.1 universal stress protein [Actinomadura sp. HBU206391]
MIGEHVLVGYKGDAGGREALAQARTIVEVTGGLLTVGAVHGPERAGSGLEARATLAQAASALSGLPADFVTQESRGAGRGLSVLASKVEADLIVIGSPGGGAHRRINLGGTADHLMHASTQAVMLTPAGHVPLDRPGRVTVAYVRRPQCDEAVVRAAAAAVRLDVPLRLMTLAAEGEDQDLLRDDLALAIRLASRSSGLAAEEIQARVGEGDDVAEAMAAVPWVEGELLICASSEDAPIHRVFLGETAFKVLRAAPCAATVLPRGTA